MLKIGIARDVLVCGLLAVAATGCGDSSEKDATPQAPKTTESVAESGYVAQLNELCAALEPKVIAAYGGAPHPAPYPIKEFEEETLKVEALYESFDAEADAIAVSDADRVAADSFEAYRQESDKAAAMMAGAAATGKQAKFDAAWYAVHDTFDNESVVPGLQAAGIVCNAC